MLANQALSRRMRDAGFTQASLADAVNRRLAEAGVEGTVSDRTVRNWLAGRTTWPQARQRVALEALFECGAEDLGFTSPTAHRDPVVPPEEPVRRRHFIAATGGAAAATVPLFAPRVHAVGLSDVIRFREEIDTLVALDDRQGGHEALEFTALSGAGRALTMQHHSATQRVRERLYGVAADYTLAAAWSAIDAGFPDRAEQHLAQALYLAGMGKDSATVLCVWNAYAVLARQRCQFGRSVDAARAALDTPIARRDPFFASLAHVRAAVGHAALGDRRQAERSAGLASEALHRASGDQPRPRWTAFYGAGELHALTATVRDTLGDAALAEAASHRALAGIPTQFTRNRALATARLAIAQLHQGDVELACSTAESVFALMSGHPLPGRLRSLLGDFYRGLITLAPDARTARAWGERFRTEWSHL